MNKFTQEDAMSKRRSHREFDDRSIPLLKVLALVQAAQGITDPSGKRTVPSAHALHPLRLYITARRVEGLASGIYQANSDCTALLPHAISNPRAELEQAALDDQPWITAAPCVITICADFLTVSEAFLDQPPHGVRGRRYAYIEAGAAAQNIQLQSTSEGLGSVLVAGFRDEATASALGIKDPLEPILHLCIGWPAA